MKPEGQNTRMCGVKNIPDVFFSIAKNRAKISYLLTEFMLCQIMLNTITKEANYQSHVAT